MSISLYSAVGLTYILIRAVLGLSLTQVVAENVHSVMHLAFELKLTHFSLRLLF